MKTLVIVTHPNIETSRINKRWAAELRKHSELMTVHELYSTYPDGKIDVEREQKLIEAHDNIVFQFPLYWYSSPPLLKQWLDEVFTYSWAYGSTGDKLRNRKLGLAISLGGKESDFGKDGDIPFTINEITIPFQATCSYTGMNFLPIFTVYGAEYHLTDEQIEQSAIDYVKYIVEIVQSGEKATV
ncbi:NAD(P)H-dependent oxidoreductase [Paenibacillus arenosi]|uniref:NAD(P)H-dependent oxidoreductase n=1 Tax=Paenibacillus arenosi TaxID=2774142 RepID=A0ABR9B140_9BACL|nr:NAD(P)H-dependent oxidoreductase [Paenibacillus arenosi]MBD8499992.1 NAD(P)H-dependent oxidoreductase [Paenibacillus arenosi]